MTRINILAPSTLPDKMLVAEYVELLRVRHIYPRPEPPVIPSQYTYGTGHVMFFADKGRWLIRRHKQLIREMKRRGYKARLTLDISHWPQDARLGDWRPSRKEKERNLTRIAFRIMTARTRQRHYGAEIFNIKRFIQWMRKEDIRLCKADSI